MEHMKNTGKISMWSQPACTQGSGLWSINCTKVIPVFSQTGQGLCMCVFYYTVWVFVFFFLLYFFHCTKIYHAEIPRWLSDKESAWIRSR